MKKTAVLFACILIFLLSACVPEKQTEVLDIGPDLDGQAGTPVDFDVLASDTLEGFEDMEPFSFVVRANISGKTTKKGGTVNVTVGTIDEVLEEDADAFAAALMKTMGSAVASELLEYDPPKEDTFGNFWDQYGATIKFYKNDLLETEGAKPYYVYKHKAGEPITLDPRVDEYIEEYYKRKEILERNL